VDFDSVNTGGWEKREGFGVVKMTISKNNGSNALDTTPKRARELGEE